MTAIKPIGTELKVRQMNGLNSKANYYGVGIQFCESGGYRSNSFRMKRFNLGMLDNTVACIELHWLVDSLVRSIHCSILEQGLAVLVQVEQRVQHLVRNLSMNQWFME
jgi:hypothetical protein